MGVWGGRGWIWGGGSGARAFLGGTPGTWGQLQVARKAGCPPPQSSTHGDRRAARSTCCRKRAGVLAPSLSPLRNDNSELLPLRKTRITSSGRFRQGASFKGAKAACLGRQKKLTGGQFHLGGQRPPGRGVACLIMRVKRVGGPLPRGLDALGFKRGPGLGSNICAAAPGTGADCKGRTG